MPKYRVNATAVANVTASFYIEAADEKEAEDTAYRMVTTDARRWAVDTWELDAVCVNVKEVT